MLGEGDLSRESSSEQFFQHLKPYIFKFEFAWLVCPIDQQVHMICLNERRFFRVAPLFCIEVDTDNDVRRELFVHQSAPAANFGYAVKEPFTLPANGTLAMRICRSCEIFLDIADALLFQI